jgi:glycosyltransferase involved in cell wall biosynthesis
VSAVSPSRPIRIERVITRLNIGGPARHTILLTRYHRDMGFLTELVAGRESPGEGNMLPLAAANGVEPVIIPALGRELSPLRDPAVLLTLYSRFRRLRPDVVCTHMSKAGAVGRVAAWLARVPVRVHTFHGHVFSGYFSPAKTRFFVELEKRLARISTRIIVLGERQQREITALGVGRPEQFVQVPLGLDLSAFLEAEKHSGELRKELAIPQDAPLAAIVARLVPIKNHAVFLRAAKLVCGSLPAARFLIVGDGPERRGLEALTEQLGLKGRVIFLGFRDDLPRIYADCDATVLSSDNEGMPVALIESLAAATPAVATDVGETREVIRDGESGFVVPPSDPEALAGALLELLRSPERAKQMGLAGRRHVYPRFSIERLAADRAGLYRSLLQEKGYSECQ